MILREGHVPLLAVAAAGGVVTGFAGWLPAVPLWLLLAWLAHVYWERRPPVPASPKGVLSPVTGRVIRVAEGHDPFLDRATLRISIDVRFPGVVPLRSPSEGKVMDTYARRGVFGRAQRPCEAGESPDCYGQWLRTDEGEDVVLAVSSRMPVSRARFDHAPGERVGQGARTGFFYLASVADVLMPVEAAPGVAIGDRVAAGESVLASLPRGA